MTQEIRDAVARAFEDVAGSAENWTDYADATLTALSACEPTPEMVEAAATEIENAGGNLTDQGVRNIARAAVSAALKMVGK